MNILVVCDSGLYAQFGTSFVHAQAAAYAALGHRVRVIVPYAIGKRDWDGKRFSGPIHRWDRDGVEVYAMRHLSLSNYGIKGFNLASALRVLPRRLDKLLEDFSPEIIHAHALGFDSEIGAFLKERLGLPLVVTTHGSDASVPFERGDLETLKRFADKADAVAAISLSLAKKIRSCGSGTPVVTILNGFRVQNLSAGRADRDCSLIQAGSLNRQKRVHVTVQALAQLRKRRPEAVLTLVGKGPERDALEGLCRELGVSEAVRFTGQLLNAQVLAEMAQARFFVMPSVNEGFGIVYLEAMASGCITVGTEGEGIADLIVSGKNGFLVPPDSPDAIVSVIEWCLEHPEEADAIAEQGRKDALDLTWEHNAEQYIELFERILEDEKKH